MNLVFEFINPLTADKMKYTWTQLTLYYSNITFKAKDAPIYQNL